MLSLAHVQLLAMGQPLAAAVDTNEQITLIRLHLHDDGTGLQSHSPETSCQDERILLQQSERAQAHAAHESLPNRDQRILSA